MLLLSGISREDGELVELDAVLEGQPKLHAKAFVRLNVHANPRVLAVHFLHNLVPLHLHLANDKTMEQLVRLQGLHYRKFTGGLEVFIDCRELFLLLILLNLCFAFWGLMERFQLLPDFKYGPKYFSNILYGPLLLEETLDGDDVDKIFFVVPLAKGGHLEISPIGKLDLDLLGVPLLM
jgi:hypothetical protein